ncbi:45555_t:CDS:2 [Gigaspora margarita]|uniref:45555_t:CDS:1 n=1 Tax=Gigaspora margarita TaxID=4874 RepID=A0ABN7VFH5_GIGMA|nr:45555_t:CDS:2 [Gigaspora margarita]
MPPRRNKGKSSGNTRCPGCGVHYKDINEHVRRKHNTTLSILKRQVAQRERSYQNVQDQDAQDQTRRDRRNERLYNRPHLIKKIDGYLRILSNQKLNAPKEDELIFDAEIQWFTNLKEFTRNANENNLSLFQSIYSDFNKLKQLKEELRVVKNKLELLEQENDTDFDLNSRNLLMKAEIVQKDTDIDNLTRKVADLNLINEERIKMINNLEDQIVKLTSDIEILRSNCKMIDAENIQNATKLHDAESKINYEKRKYDSFVTKHERELENRDERESNLYSHITLLKNRIKDLESNLDISTRPY